MFKTRYRPKPPALAAAGYNIVFWKRKWKSFDEEHQTTNAKDHFYTPSSLTFTKIDCKNPTKNSRMYLPPGKTKCPQTPHHLSSWPHQTPCPRKQNRPKQHHSTDPKIGKRNRAFKKIARVIRKQKTGLTKLEIELHDGSIQELTDKEAIHSMLLQHNNLHFQQSNETAFSEWPRRRQIGPAYYYTIYSSRKLLR